MWDRIKNYKKSYLIINVILALLLIFFVANLFLFKHTSYKFLILITSLPTVLFILLFGYERKSRRFKYELIFYVFAYCALFLLITYILGLFIGFNRNVYRLNSSNLIHNILPYFILIVVSEILRYEISRKGDGSGLSYVLVTMVLISIDLTLFLTTYDLNTGDGQIKYICAVAMPSLFKNIVLLYFVKNGGIYPSLVYRVMLDLKLVLLPIFPAFGIYFESIIYTILPVLMAFIISLHLKQFKNSNEQIMLSIRGYRLYNYLLYFSLFAVVFAINILVSCSFKYNMIAIGSASMQPKINKGDAIVYEKLDKDNLPKVGEILVFHKDDKTVVHRIIEVVDISDKEKIYYTKGDNNETPDGYPIQIKDIRGVVKKRIRYIGIPSVILGELIK